MVLIRGEEGVEEEEAIFFLRGEEESLRGELGGVEVGGRQALDRRL